MSRGRLRQTRETDSKRNGWKIEVAQNKYGDQENKKDLQEDRKILEEHVWNVLRGKK